MSAATGNSSFSIELTEQNFAEVVARSRQVPVLVDFWADWCAPCKQIGPILDKLAREMKGAFLLAKVNADQQPLVTQQFGVRGLPTLKLVVQGQLVDELVGAHPESAIRQMLAPYLGEPPAGDAEAEAEADPLMAFHARVIEAVEAGQLEDALAALAQHLEKTADDHRGRRLLAELLLQEGRLDEAAALLDAAPEAAAAELRGTRALLAFSRRLEGVPSLQQLQGALASGAADTQTKFNAALRLVGGGRAQEGMDMLLEILRRDRAFGEDAARKALLEVLDLLGRDDPLTAVYRRKLASALY